MEKKPIKYSVVDAFTDSAFKGNPAAVCFLEEDRDDRWLQAVAAEFNLAETCYLTRITDSDHSAPRFGLRWFTPTNEVELCGHATLAAAYTLFKTDLINSNIIEFATLSGILTATKVPDVKTANGSNVQNGDAPEPYCIELNFPADPSNEFTGLDGEVSLISRALDGACILEMRRTTVTDDILVVLPSAKAVTDLQPQFDAIRKFPGSRGVIVTAIAPPESGYDFYSRFFAPKHGIDEDPVTGSAHCALASYWCKKLGKSDVHAYQASSRGGAISIYLDEQNQRVLLRGKAVTVMDGTVLV